MLKSECLDDIHSENLVFNNILFFICFFPIIHNNLSNITNVFTNKSIEWNLIFVVLFVHIPSVLIPSSDSFKVTWNNF